MTEQQDKAIGILNKLRETYINRITEFIIDNEVEMLDAASGDSYGYTDTEELAEVSEKLRQLMLILEAYRGAVQNDSQVVSPSADISFQIWADLTKSGDLDRATYALAYLFQCSLDLANQCMGWFLNQLRYGHPVFQKVQELRESVKKEPTKAIALLHECFGLEGDPAVFVLSNLQVAACH